MTVERAALVKWWPLVDATKLEFQPGDVFVLRTAERLNTNAAMRVREEWEHAVPGTKAILLTGGLDVVSQQRAMPEMRFEDLYLPERKTTMEA